MIKFLTFLILLTLSTTVFAKDTYYNDWIYGIPPKAKTAIIAFTEKDNAMFGIICTNHKLFLFTTIHNRTDPMVVNVEVTNKTGINPFWTVDNLIGVNERFLKVLKDGHNVYVTYPDGREIKFSLYGSGKAIQRLEYKCEEI